MRIRRVWVVTIAVVAGLALAGGCKKKESPAATSPTSDCGPGLMDISNPRFRQYYYQELPASKIFKHTGGFFRGVLVSTSNSPFTVTRVRVLPDLDGVYLSGTKPRKCNDMSVSWVFPTIGSTVSVEVMLFSCGWIGKPESRNQEGKVEFLDSSGVVIGCYKGNFVGINGGGGPCTSSSYVACYAIP